MLQAYPAGALEGRAGAHRGVVPQGRGACPRQLGRRLEVGGEGVRRPPLDASPQGLDVCPGELPRGQREAPGAVDAASRLRRALRLGPWVVVDALRLGGGGGS